MRWQEFELQTRAYQAAEQTKIVAQNAAAEANRQEREAEALRQEQLEQERVRKILEKFRAEEVLTAIKDEVWHGGEIEEFEGGWNSVQRTKGVRLISTPYPVVVVRGHGRGLDAVVRVEKTALEISVTPKDQHQPDRVIIADRNVYDVARGRGISVIDKVRELGLADGLKFAELDRLSLSIDKPNVNIASEDAIGQFNNTILEYVDFRESVESTPFEIKTLAFNIFDELPRQLFEVGEISPQGLREWAHDVRGSSVVYRAAGRILPLKI